jgi:hypothetical protein
MTPGEFEILANQDFKKAEITVVHLRIKREDTSRILLFSAIEFLSSETPSQGPLDSNLRLSSEFQNYVYVRRLETTVQDALDFYLSCSINKANLPQTPNDISRGWGPYPLGTTKYLFEPDFPNLSFEYNREAFWGQHSYWCNRSGGIRRSQLLPIEPIILGNILQNSEIEKLRGFVAESTKLDVLARSKILGSVHLILDNPIFISASERLTKDRMGIAFEIDIAPGKNLDGLKLYVFERRPLGLGKIICKDQLSSSNEIDLGYDHFETECIVVCPVRGTLWSGSSSTFLKGIGFNMTLTSGNREVHVPATSSRPESAYLVPIVATRSSFSIGKEGLDGAALLALAKEERSDEDSRNENYRWFDGNPEDAEIFIRTQIQMAKRVVYIVDPYFGLTELMRFGLSNGDKNTKINILTSSEYLRDKRNQVTPDDLARQLVNISRSPQANIIEIRVGLGDRPPIHDRFLIIDDLLWSLGSSLNEFGSRGTVAIRMPEASEIIKNIQAIWSGASNLNEYIAMRVSTNDPLEHQENT